MLPHARLTPAAVLLMNFRREDNMGVHLTFQVVARGLSQNFLFGISDGQNIPCTSSFWNDLFRVPPNWPPRVPETALTAPCHPALPLLEVISRTPLRPLPRWSPPPANVAPIVLSPHAISQPEALLHRVSRIYRLGSGESRAIRDRGRIVAYTETTLRSCTEEFIRSPH